jgi:carboxypeptidase C (cathepsin A)
MVSGITWIAPLILALLFPAGIAGADSAPGGGKDGPCPNVTKAGDVLPADQKSITHHGVTVEDAELRYTATAGSLPVQAGETRGDCRVFYVGYQVEPADSQRPLTFVFNGGPGASSAYLHLGALGPKCLLFEKEGALPGLPPRLTDNVHTWLRFTDLVFVDPVGTGYSGCTNDTNGSKTDGHNRDGNAAIETETWGVREDLAALARFLRLYLTRNGRWLSPRFLVGESYGGFRVAALADLLQSEHGIGLNGVVLVSPALEFSLLSGDEYGLLPWVVTVPSLTATARYHNKSTGKTIEQENPREALGDVERFAVEALLPGLAKGDTAAVNGQLASSIGLSEERVARLHARIPPALFAKELLSDKRRLVSQYDGSWSSIDPEPASPLPTGNDPLLVRLNTLLAAALNSYVREQLKFETDIPYKLLNRKVSEKWNWISGLERRQGFVGVAENLKRGMSVNKELKVLIAHGVFDLVTPYFGSVIVTRQMALDPAIATNLRLKVYPGGHMFYTHPTGRLRLFEDAQRLFESAQPH